MKRGIVIIFSSFIPFIEFYAVNKYLKMILHDLNFFNESLNIILHLLMNMPMLNMGCCASIYLFIIIIFIMAAKVKVELFSLSPGESKLISSFEEA